MQENIKKTFHQLHRLSAEKWGLEAYAKRPAKIMSDSIIHHYRGKKRS